MKNNFITERINDDIDISKILNIFIRNKFLIASFTFLFFTAASLYGLSKKRIWEGEFQIVLDKPQNNLGINAQNLLNSSILNN